MKKLTLFTYCMLVCGIVLGQVQLGQNLNGLVAGDRFGRSLSISGDGSTLAIGAPLHKLNSSDSQTSGKVQVFRWINHQWVEIYNNLIAEAVGDCFGCAVDLNIDGTILAVGSPFNDANGISSGSVRVYKDNGSVWEQIGGDIDGTYELDWFGHSIALNDSGNILAVGAPYNDEGSGALLKKGQVKVFEWINNSWTQIGVDLYGENSGDEFGFDIGMNKSGDKIVVGAPYFDLPFKSNTGKIYVYKKENSSWVLDGAPIEGDSGNDWAGFSVAMNGVGNQIVSGYYYSSDGSTRNGKVKVFKLESDVWNTYGDKILGEQPGIHLGEDVSMNDEGNIIAVSSGIYNTKGGVFVYEYSSQSSKYNLATTVEGKNTDDAMSKVDINDQGTIIATGSPLNDDSFFAAGQVRVFDVSAQITLSTSKNALENIRIKIDRSSKKIKILESLGQIKLYDLAGKLLKSNNNQLDYSNFNHGVYILMINTLNGKYIEKVVL